MLKIKLLLSLLRKHMSWTVILSLLLFLGYREIERRSGLREANERIINLKKFHLEQLLKAKGAYHTIAKTNDSLKGVGLAQQRIIIRYEEMLIHGPGIQTDIEGRKKVSIDTTIICMGIKGWTLTDPPEYSLKVIPTPLLLDIYITDIGDKVHGIITPFPDDCYKIDSVNFQVAPDIKGGSRDGFDKGEFFLGGAIVGCGVIIYNLLR